MATAAAITSAISAAVAIYGLIVNGQNQEKADEIAEANLGLTAEQIALQKDELNLHKQDSYLNGLGMLNNINKSIAEMEGAKVQYGIGIRNAQSQIMSYDMWLGNYEKQYAQEVQSKQAQTDQLMASGKEVYDNFLNAIGYSDAIAGATGRVGAGTSQAHVTQGIDQKLVDYVGADRTLDANGGLFGSQLTAANMEMEQLKIDLEFQRKEMEANRAIALETIGDYESAISQMNQSISNSRAARDEYERIVNGLLNGFDDDPEADILTATTSGPGVDRPTDAFKKPPPYGDIAKGLVI